MEINETLFNDKMINVFKKFESINFNTLTQSKKEELVINLMKITANCLDINSFPDKVVFTDSKELGMRGALFDCNKNIILLNKELFNKRFNPSDIAMLIDNAIHETVHFCQNESKIFIKYLKTPLPQPYNVFQPHENDAYTTTKNFLLMSLKYLSKELNKPLGLMCDSYDYLKTASKDNIAKRGYETNENIINKQVEEMIPFYGEVYKIDEMNENHQLDIKIKMFNQNIDAISLDDNGITGILNVKKHDCDNKLHFTIKDNICFINNIVKIEKDNRLKAVSTQDKEKLIIILNKIISVGNNVGFFNCKDFIINPISVVDTKKEYDNFIENVKNNLIEISEKITDISEKQIEKKMFKNIEER